MLVKNLPIQGQRTNPPAGGQKARESKILRSTCEQGRGAEGAHILFKTVVDTVPLAAEVGTERTNKEVIGVTKNDTPKKDKAGVIIFINFPVLGNKMLIFKKSIHNIRVKHRLPSKLFPKLIARKRFFSFLSFASRIFRQ